MTEAAAPASIPYGTNDTVSVAGLPADATGTVTFTSSGSTLCVATLPALSCATPTSLIPGLYPVTATYSGDGNYTGATVSTASFTVTIASTSMTESAAPASIPYGSTDTLSVSGLPVGATGSVTYKSGGSTLCVAALPATSCSTSAALTPGAYPVTATYSGDSNYTGTTASRRELHGHQGDHRDDRISITAIDRLRVAGHAVGGRIACRRNGNRDLHIRCYDPVLCDAPGNKLPDRRDAWCGNIPRDRHLPR